MKHYDALIVGSSTIKRWQDINDYFPGSRILNRGFGGSHMSDVLYYADELIFSYQPAKLFIYEGDNDIVLGKSVKQVKHDFKELFGLIKKRLPKTKVYVISAKPAIQKARVGKKKEYVELNQWSRKYCKKHRQFTFINIWPLMLGPDGKPREDIFVKDGVHMNAKGYDIWAKALHPLLKE